MSGTPETDAPPVEPAGQKEFPCGQCGGKMTFDPAAQAIVCPYCGHENRIPQSEADIRELDFAAALAAAAADETTRVAVTITCSGCGAETTFDEDVAADACPFCGSAIVAGQSEHRDIQPGSLLPFGIDRKRAFAAFRTWTDRLWFAPNALKRYARAESNRLNGVYVPYWTYDSDTTSFYRGERGDDYWVTERYTATENGQRVQRTRQVRKTRWRPVTGTVYQAFDDVLVLGSNSLPTKYAEQLAPWDLEALVPFSPNYLAGFRTERYHIGLEAGFEQARAKMDEAIRASVRRDIGGDHQRIHGVATEHDNVRFKHLLLPVWISAYRFRDKAYRFMVNARTGEVQGERPWSWVKLTLTGLAFVALAGIGAYVWSRYR